MLTAKEARRKSLLQQVGKEAMEVIDRAITHAIAFGKTSTSIDCGGMDKEVIIDIITPELEELGYKVKFIPAKPLPHGCPPDQWYSTDDLEISWEEVDDNERIHNK